MSIMLLSKGLDFYSHSQAATTIPPTHPLRSSYCDGRTSRSRSSLCDGGKRLFSVGPALSSITRRGSVVRSWRKNSNKFTRSSSSCLDHDNSVVMHQEHSVALLESFQNSCDTRVEKLRALVDAMVEEFEAGLATETGPDLKMLPAYVESLPTGKETGSFYALDLGGTNFRVLRADLGGHEERLVNETSTMYTIPHNLMIGGSDELFDFIAGKLGDFIVSEEPSSHLGDRKRELGFTFSFPVMQHSIASGTLIHWSKGFNVVDTVGKDVVTVLRDAIERRGLDLDIVALVNDTVGTLAAGRYWNHDVMLAVILGTGTNACYVERAEAVPKWQGPRPASGMHVINTEWGNFNSPLLPITAADKDLDRESVNPGHHIFEKLMSGMYLGEITRRVVSQFVQEASLFGDQASSAGNLSQKFSLTTPDISKIHSDETPNLEIVGEVLDKAWSISSTSFAEREAVLSIVKIITRRGARLAAAGIVALLTKIGGNAITTSTSTSTSTGNGSITSDVASRIGEKKVVVAMDGGLYQHYSQFREYLHDALEELLGKEVASTVSIELSKDGSGIGAALLAACHSKYRKH